MSNWISYITCNNAGTTFITRWAIQADTLEEAQAKTVAQAGETRSLGGHSELEQIETYPQEHLHRRQIRRRQVPLFEVDPHDYG